MIGLIMMLAGPAAPAFTLTPAEARSITRQCHAPAAWIEVRAGGLVRFTPPTEASYRKVDCVLLALRKHVKQIEFIGNRAPD